MASLTLWSQMFPKNIDLHGGSYFKFFHCREISLTAFMDDFTNQAKCRCKAFFQIHVITLAFICCGWSINWVKIILEPTGIPLHPLLRHLL